MIPKCLNVVVALPDATLSIKVNGPVNLVEDFHGHIVRDNSVYFEKNS